MLSIRVDLLTDRYHATAFNDRNKGEWPPHPGRLFSAMVATWAEDDDPDDQERELLLWLEGQSPPELSCSGPGDVAERDVLTFFVPVNDPGGSELPLPENRGRQPRTFPCVAPAAPTVYFTWPAAEPTDQQVQVLDGLLCRLGRLGHSSSFVAASIAADVPEPTFRPSDAGDLPLRVPATGLLDVLEAVFEQHQGSEPRVLPNLIVPYTAEADEYPVPHGAFSTNWFVLRLKGDAHDQAAGTRMIKDVPLGRSLPWSRAIRAAIQAHAEPGFKAHMGGHTTDGGLLDEPHPAVVPLGFVNAPFADGRVRAFAIVPPNDISDENLAALGRALRSWEQRSGGMSVYTNRSSEAFLESVPPEDLPSSIRPGQWTEPCDVWATATPLVLDRFPKGMDSAEPAVRERAAAQIRSTITRAVTLQGLPQPALVEFSRDGLMRGSGPVRTFLPYRHGRRSTRKPISVHALIEFPEPVRGPLIIGEGRHLGYGLMRPIKRGGQ